MWFLVFSVIYLIILVFSFSCIRKNRGLSDNHPWKRPYFECQSHIYDSRLDPGDIEPTHEIGKKVPYHLRNFIFLIFVFGISQNSFAKELIRVPIALFEPIQLNQSYIGETYRQEFISSVDLYEKQTNILAQSCGYHLEISRHFFSRDFPSKLVEDIQSLPSNTWLILGPRQSDNYLITSKVAPEIPSVSTMAGSQAVFALGPLHKTLGTANSTLAKKLVSRAIQEKVKRTYFTLSKSDCFNCQDLSQSFDLEVKFHGIKKLQEFSFPDLKAPHPEVLEWIRIHQPGFVFLPIKGEFAALWIKQLHDLSPSSIFLGGDEWGDVHIGAVRNLEFPQNLVAFTARPYPLAEILFKQSKTNKKESPKYAPGVAILLALENLTELLCEEKPQNFIQFKSAFQKPVWFKPKKEVHLYSIKKGKFQYAGIL